MKIQFLYIVFFLLDYLLKNVVFVLKIDVISLVIKLEIKL